MNFNNNNIY